MAQESLLRPKNNVNADMLHFRGLNKIQRGKSVLVKSKIKPSLCSRYYAEANNELRGQAPRLSA